MSRPCSELLPVLLLLGLAGVAASAPQEPKPDAKAAPDWITVAKEQKLTEEQIKLLRDQKFLVTDQSMKQVFSAYIGGRVPVFITSDSILNGYHVLFEESIYRLEQANARKLPALLERTAKNLDRGASSFKGDADLIAAARKRAAIFLGVARNLLDETILPDDAALRAIVQEEAKRVVAGTATHKPEWLGKPDPGFLAIDYSRFKPRGFYTRSATLRRHFRAVAWLQAIPFRLEMDGELAAFLLMHKAYFDREKEEDADSSLWSAYRTFLGDRDDWDLSNAWRIPKELSKEAFAEIRVGYHAEAERDGGPQINDQLRFYPPEPGGKPELVFRFLSAFRLPDGVMFHRTMQREIGDRKFPTGLEVAAVLGSPFARERLAKEDPKLVKAVDGARPLFQGKNLYADYLRCLGVLLERIEPDAPEFMRSAAWQTKTCQTALAGWAQMRHTWALQAKVGVMYMSAVRQEAGFVEPVPEFYGRLAKLIDETRDALREAGALNIDPKEMLQELTADVRAAQEIVKKAREKNAKLSSFTPEQRDLLAKFDPRLENEWDQPETEGRSAKALEDLSGLLMHYQLALTADDQRYFHVLGLSLPEIAGKWDSLSKLCHRLEVLAHKQLRKVPFSDEENEFIKGYGKTLAGIMFYSGNSYLTPRDDAMRVVDVFSNPQAGAHLHVGISRPRPMWVLYPTKNGDVLCCGAVIPYAEFTHPNRLTDAEWKTLLNSPRRPEPPAWAKSVIPTERAREK